MWKISPSTFWPWGVSKAKLLDARALVIAADEAMDLNAGHGISMISVGMASFHGGFLN